VSLVELQRLPNHIAIIMDGNGRWAKERGLRRSDGHQQGARAVREIVTTSRRLGIKALTVYAFSAQNWARPDDEVAALMSLLADYMTSERDTLLENSIRFRAIGRTTHLPPHIQRLVNELSAVTAENSGMTLTLCLSYGGREEIVDAARTLMQRVVSGELSLDELDEHSLSRALPSLDDGPVDLMIRTGGEYRVSNFLIWAGAYAELYFSHKLWPDFGPEDLYDAIYAFQQRNRRFGLADNVQGPDASGSQEVSAKAISR
jgi:undecaprenyl diphosphate synthase